MVEHAVCLKITEIGLVWFRALALGARNREFESLISDHLDIMVLWAVVSLNDIKEIIV